ncbi:DUF418 domain-containing protein [Paraoerskovia sediminicola]|uniref:DUF418 domain-containing protein n=1 Tax=Paraoerskovia sediminicola TaxID=1138587 RepID=UPI00257306FE|nr:DUF418 domain-containing protein [Paraoerskovia sediminicola]
MLAFWGSEAIGHVGLRYPYDGTGAVTDYLLTGHYPAVVWMAYVLLGLALGRLGLTARRTQTALVAWGAAAAVVGYAASFVATEALGGASTIAYTFESTTVVRRGEVPDGAAWPDPAYLLLAGPHTDTWFEVLGSGGFAVLVVGGALLATRSRAVALVLSPLAAVGAMALTVYTLQIVALWVVREWFGLDLVRSPTSNEALVVMTLASLVLATLWRVALGKGPLERLVTGVAARAASVPATEPHPSVSAPDAPDPTEEVPHGRRDQR